MLLLVLIDLSRADLALFESYENKTLALLGRYGASLKMRVRSIDGSREVHLLEFPDAPALEAFRSEPARMAAQDLWQSCGASATIEEVAHVA